LKSNDPVGTDFDKLHGLMLGDAEKSEDSFMMVRGGASSRRSTVQEGAKKARQVTNISDL